MSSRPMSSIRWRTSPKPSTSRRIPQGPPHPNPNPNSNPNPNPNPHPHPHPNPNPNPNPNQLLVLGGESPEALIVATRAALERLGNKETDAEAEFGALLLATVAAEKAAAAPRFALCLVCSAATLKKELELAANGVATAAATGRPYASVAGSCFSPKPTRSKQVAMTAAPAAPTLRTLLATAAHAHSRARARARELTCGTWTWTWMVGAEV